MAFNRRSKNITQGVSRSPNRSMYYAMGYEKADFDKPMVGVANGHSTITPCNSGLQKLADIAIKTDQGMRRQSASVRHADDFRRHVDGHRRHEVLADLARSHRRLHRNRRQRAVDGRRARHRRLRQEHAGRHDRQWLRTNVPSIYVYGGTIKPGNWKGKDLTIVSAFEAVGEFTAGRMSQEDFDGIERNACPSSGSCGGMYTANTMSSSFEALGMALPYSSTMANPDDEKVGSAAESARVLVEAIKKRSEAARHRHPQGDRKRSRRHHGDRRFDQCGAALTSRSRTRRKSTGPSTTSNACARKCRSSAI